MQVACGVCGCDRPIAVGSQGWSCPNYGASALPCDGALGPFVWWPRNIYETPAFAVSEQAPACVPAGGIGRKEDAR